MNGLCRCCGYEYLTAASPILCTKCLLGYWCDICGIGGKVPEYVKKIVVLTVEVPVEIEEEFAADMTDQDWIDDGVNEMVFGSVVNAELIDG